MKLLLLAIGHKLPAWADAGYAEYAQRFPREMPLVLKALKAEPRTTGKAAPALMQAEAQRIEGALAAHGSAVRRVVLDEHGARHTTAALAERLQAWRADGRDVAILIGGPDGLDAGLKASAEETLRLSDLTLPHALARVLLAEALYRAWTLSIGHPYHRE